MSIASWSQRKFLPYRVHLSGLNKWQRSTMHGKAFWHQHAVVYHMNAFQFGCHQVVIFTSFWCNDSTVPGTFPRPFATKSMHLPPFPTAKATPATQPSCFARRTYAIKRRFHGCFSRTVAMVTLPLAQKGMIVPKENVYVKFVDWGYDPSIMYGVFYT